MFRSTAIALTLGVAVLAPCTSPTTPAVQVTPIQVDAPSIGAPAPLNHSGYIIASS